MLRAAGDSHCTHTMPPRSNACGPLLYGRLVTHIVSSVVYRLKVPALNGLICVSLVLLRHEAHRSHHLVLDGAIPFPSLLHRQMALLL